MKRLGIYSLLVCIGVLSVARSGVAQTGPTDPYGGMEGRIFDAGGGFKMPYRLVRPPGYNAATKYPLVVFLHGSGESGTDNRLQISKNIGTNTPGSIFTTTANLAKFPTFFIAPQTPDPTIAWTSGSKPLAAVLKLITALEGEFSIDPSRLYLTGLSIGGRGTFVLLIENPTLFAAAIPMSGEGDTTMAGKFAKVPLWAFHGAMDPAINVAGSRNMVAAMRAAGGHPLYTEYPNGQHDIWFMGYTTPQLLPWMNSQHLGQEDSSTDAGVPLPRDAAVDTGGAAGAAAGGATGAAGNGGSSGAAGATGAAGAGGSTGAAGNGGSTGAAGNGGSTGSAGGASGATGVAGNGGSTGAAGAAGGSTGTAGGPGATGGGATGCACGLGGAGSSGLALGMLAVAAALAARRRRA
jgi:MYXO-CTERM domain-containing protein